MTTPDNDFLLETASPIGEEIALPVPELSPTYVYKPPPPPPPILVATPRLRREAPQPERVAVIRASPTPLIAAAQPLLDVLANMPKTLDADQLDAFHRGLQREVANFQSVCVEAHLQFDVIVGTSYILCCAIDEAACLYPWGDGDEGTGSGWMARQLAVEFHEDTEGGVKVFRLADVFMRRLADNSGEGMLDALDVVSQILDLGFLGVYRRSPRDQWKLGGLHTRIRLVVQNERRRAEDARYVAERDRLQREAVFVPRSDSYSFEFPDWFHYAVALFIDVILPVAGITGFIGWTLWMMFWRPMPPLP